MQRKPINVAVIGATGMVGAAILSILEERKFPVGNLYLLASKRSIGEARNFNNKAYWVEDLFTFDFTQTQLAFFCASNEIAKEYVPKAAQAGNIIIDKSSYFRYHADVPLIVPEVNGALLSKIKPGEIIASPNCSTIPIVMVLKPIHEAVGISRVNIATYQSVSGSGKEAVAELVEQTGQLLNGKPIKPKIYSQQIAFNVLPYIDDLLENGYTKEEMKVVWETQKILNDQSIGINPTAVRVPVFYGHSAALHLETKKKISLKKTKVLLENFPGIILKNFKIPYPTPVQDAAGTDAVYVGRIREDISCIKGLNLWVVTDNIRKGAALNAVQIAEKIIELGVLK